MKKMSLVLLFALTLVSCSGQQAPMHGNHDMHMPMGDVQTFVPGEDIDINSLRYAKAPETITVESGQTVTLTPTIVRKTINGKDYVMYGYNGQIPGPTLKVTQGTEFKVLLRNDIDMPTTVHWHGIRLDNAFDGVPGITQPEVKEDGTFEYTVKVPDEGLFWYHPHLREDIQQNLGLFGNIISESKAGSFYGDAQQEVVLTLGDLLTDGKGNLVPYGKDGPTHTLMGRYGNLLLINGDAYYKGVALTDTVVRYYITNVANARPFKLAFEGARMKLVGTDGGHYNKEQFIDSLTISPSERYIVDVYFEKPGIVTLTNAAGNHQKLGEVRIFDKSGTPSYKESFETLGSDANLYSTINLSSYIKAKPDKNLRLELDTAGSMGGMIHASGDLEDGVEWEDSMPQMNAMSNTSNVHWRLVDEDTGNVNMDIHWSFKQGDLIKVHIQNDDESMQHPIHFHGQRFLVLLENGKAPAARAWKDSVLVRNGESVDILLEASNPGEWMFHCHIAEHMEDGMMGMMSVE